MGIQPDSLGTEGSSPEVKEAEMWSQPCLELYFHLPMCLHNFVLEVLGRHVFMHDWLRATGLM
jgi:hypothetical protein